jgi:hypothetical protein
MPPKTNPHVERLHQFLPFDASHDKIYAEYQVDNALSLDTRAQAYINEIVSEGRVRVIILTGDAGHGKTYLCRQLIQDYLECKAPEARLKLINECSDGRLIMPIQQGDKKLPLRIFKDFSEYAIDVAVGYLESALADTEAITVICVNEGRFRAVLEESNDRMAAELYSLFSESFTNGKASVSGIWHIINLNYQSVATEEIRGLLENATYQWLDGRSWSICQSCDSKKKCPISRNADLLSENNKEKVKRLACVFSVAERLGTVITIRDMLMALAYLFTGGLKCKDVHDRAGKTGWQNAYAFYSLLFVPPKEISPDQLSRIPVLETFRLLDPGRRSERSIDDELINRQGVFEHGLLDLQFSCTIGTRIHVDAANGIDEITGNARNRSEHHQERVIAGGIVSHLRRRYFFHNVNSGHDALKRLGFEYADEFVWLLKNEQDAARKAKIKTTLVAGLHTLQGMNIGADRASLYLVDPAFSMASNRAAIISRKIAGNVISIIKQSEVWPSGKNEKYEIPSSVDWLEREIILQVKRGSDAKTATLSLDIMAFDFLMRAASGFVSENFYSHEIRRILNFLGRLAEQGEISGTIDAVIRGDFYAISIEEGDVIQVSGGSI